MSQPVQLIVLAHCACDGLTQMAIDEALLDWVRGQPGDVFALRTYQWQPAWLSLGKHQASAALKQLLQPVNTHKAIQAGRVVRRPTGGRAIWHHNDTSFAMVTNMRAITGQSVSQSYCVLSTWMRAALRACAVEVRSCGETDSRAYTLAESCFETHTPYDLIDAATGQKLMGAAQLRRQGGLLQHGALFSDVSGQNLTAALQQQLLQSPLFKNATLTNAIVQHAALQNTSTNAFKVLPIDIKPYRARYEADSASILASLSTSSPASV